MGAPRLVVPRLPVCFNPGASQQSTFELSNRMGGPTPTSRSSHDSSISIFWGRKVEFTRVRQL
ncbi:hypothetical protein NMG60_11032279 [Bertholletia excelsa]